MKRTETATIRLTPRVRALAEIAARAQRRTLSSFIEMAVEEAISHSVLRGRDGNVPLLEADLWDTDPDERQRRIAARFPYLLTFDEEVEAKRRGWLPA